MTRPDLPPTPRTEQERQAVLAWLRVNEPEALHAAASAMVRDGLRRLREDAIRREQAEPIGAAA